jgi:hypothetical protein
MASHYRIVTRYQLLNQEPEMKLSHAAGTALAAALLLALPAFADEPAKQPTQSLSHGDVVKQKTQSLSHSDPGKQKTQSLSHGDAGKQQTQSLSHGDPGKQKTQSLSHGDPKSGVTKQN